MKKIEEIRDIIKGNDKLLKEFYITLAEKGAYVRLKDRVAYDEIKQIKRDNNKFTYLPLIQIRPNNDYSINCEVFLDKAAFNKKFRYRDILLKKIYSENIEMNNLYLRYGKNNEKSKVEDVPFNLKYYELLRNQIYRNNISWVGLYYYVKYKKIRDLSNIITSNIKNLRKFFYSKLFYGNPFKILINATYTGELGVFDPEIMEFEGTLRNSVRNHKYRERNPKNIRIFKQSRRGQRECDGCQKYINKYYGLQKTNAILEVHHIEALKYFNKPRKPEFSLLCPNCHRAIHRMMAIDNKKRISIEDFKKRINKK
jgi:hypothetical protein